MQSPEFEDPHGLLGRLKLGREEYCQRLLTMLILDGPYPRWNTRSTPSADGLRFLSLLENLSFGRAGEWSEPVFVDELDLPGRHEWEQGGAPDHALQDVRRLWLIELKTEAGSHRPGQIPTYFDLGRSHYPNHQIDITYLTGPLSKPPPPVPDGSRFAHVTWSEVLPLVHQVWSDRSPLHRDLGLALDDVLAGLDKPWADWRTGRLRDAAPVELLEPADPRRNALDLARLTADDHHQRALDFATASLEELQLLRLDVLGDIRETGDAELAHVQPWLWRWESLGLPLTSAGRDLGYELRFSWYQKPVI